MGVKAGDSDFIEREKSGKRDMQALTGEFPQY
jgi:hypothetical protein